MDVKEILEKVKSGELSTSDAEKIIKRAPYEEMGFAKLDLHREIRQGFPEVVFCQGKKDEYLKEIFAKLYSISGKVLGTRATKEQYEVVKSVVPEVIYDEEARVLMACSENVPQKKAGKIVVCTAGTADIPVAKEAKLTAEFFGAEVLALYDIGVSGIHRLLDNIDLLQDANCVVAIAGMEGALASVIGGLVSCPVIAVPTSVGYGASLEGLSALLTMINSCANGVAVVNIDNGYGAGYMAAQINRQSVKSEK